VRELEARMNEILESFGLGEWQAIWEPDSTQPRGQIQLENRIILIHDDKPEEVLKTLTHEIVELKLRPMLKPYRTLVNALIQFAEERIYESKEKVIEDLLPFLLKSIEDEYMSQEPREGINQLER
jgi:hypothetical protein